jgi:hypothetical protein
VVEQRVAVELLLEREFDVGHLLDQVVGQELPHLEDVLDGEGRGDAGGANTMCRDVGRGAVLGEPDLLNRIEHPAIVAHVSIPAWVASIWIGLATQSARMVATRGDTPNPSPPLAGDL